MKILITGGCGFVGTNIALCLSSIGHNVSSLDNLSRNGSRYNLNLLKKEKINNFKIDIKSFHQLTKIPRFDLIIDCCAEAAVEVSKDKIDKVINSNLIGTLNILKKIKADKSKIIFLSSSRVYPINNFDKIVNGKVLKNKIKSNKKFNEKENVNGPKTIYGFTKLASEMLIEEFAYAFGIKYIINRCGVISGPLQFGKQEQGFVSLWVWKHLNKKKMKYIGYGGFGNQVRDVLHIQDLCELIKLQINKMNIINNELFTVGGSNKSYTSLKDLTKLCEKISNNKIKFSKVPKTSVYDIPYYITNNRLVTKTYKWKPKRDIFKVVYDVYVWLKNDKIKINKYF